MVTTDRARLPALRAPLRAPADRLHAPEAVPIRLPWPTLALVGAGVLLSAALLSWRSRRDPLQRSWHAVSSPLTYTVRGSTATDAPARRAAWTVAGRGDTRGPLRLTIAPYGPALGTEPGSTVESIEHDGDGGSDVDGGGDVDGSIDGDVDGDRDRDGSGDRDRDGSGDGDGDGSGDGDRDGSGDGSGDGDRDGSGDGSGDSGGDGDGGIRDHLDAGEGRAPIAPALARVATAVEIQWPEILARDVDRSFVWPALGMEREPSALIDDVPARPLDALRPLPPRALGVMLPAGDPLLLLATAHAPRVGKLEAVPLPLDPAIDSSLEEPTRFAHRLCLRIDVLIGARAYATYWQAHPTYLPVNANAGGLWKFGGEGTIWLDSETDLPCRIAARLDLPRLVDDHPGTAQVDWVYDDWRPAAAP